MHFHRTTGEHLNQAQRQAVRRHRAFPAAEARKLAQLVQRLFTECALEPIDYCDSVDMPHPIPPDHAVV